MYIVRLYFFVGKHINIEIKSRRTNHEMLKSDSPGRSTGKIFFSFHLLSFLDSTGCTCVTQKKEIKEEREKKTAISTRTSLHQGTVRAPSD